MIDPVTRLLIECCAAPEADHRNALGALTEGDWVRLIAVADRTRSLPLLSRIAERTDLARSVTVQLHEHAREAIMLTLEQGRAIKRVVSVLHQAGFAPIALKGLALAYGGYPHPHLRPLRDIDLLLPAKEAEQAQQLLLSLPGFDRLAGAGRYGVEYGHQLPEIVDLDSGLVIELHHRLNARGWPGEQSLLNLIGKKPAMASLLGEDVCVPAAEANFLHLVEHATWHHLFANGPLFLSDLHFLATRHGPLDWLLVRKQAEEMGLHHALELAVVLARQAGAAWVPDGLVADSTTLPPELIEAAYAALLEEEEAGRQHAMFYRMAERSGGVGVAHAIRQALRPDPYQLARLSQREVTDPLRWLGYPKWLVEKGGVIFALSAILKSQLPVIARTP